MGATDSIFCTVWFYTRLFFEFKVPLNIITHPWSDIFGDLAQTPLKLDVDEYRWLG